MVQKLSKEVDFKTLSKICTEKWNNMTGFQKIRFEQMSKYDESRYEAEMTVYKNKLNKFALLWGEAQLCLPYVCL